MQRQEDGGREQKRKGKEKMVNMLVCIFCKREFIKRPGRGRIPKYCSKRCREKNRSALREKSLTIKCARCGKEVKRVSAGHKFCGPDCKKQTRSGAVNNPNVLRRCRTCRQLKPLTFEYFSFLSRNKDGHNEECIACRATKKKALRSTEDYKARCKQPAFRERKKIVDRKHRASVGYKSKRNEKERELRKTDTNYNIKNRMRALIYSTLRQGKCGQRWQALVGYSVDELRVHIEKQFKEGMSWERFMQGEIHIDHIVPISRFKYSCTDDAEFKRCWAITNLQPLWAFDNISKGNRIME